MGYYKELLSKWQNISNAMAEIDKDHQSRYFSDFKTEVNNRLEEYKSLSEREENAFNYVPFPFEAELDDFYDDAY
jgi:hypothetical protein